MLNGFPAVCDPIDPPPMASTRKWSSGPALTVKEFDTPISAPVPRPLGLSVIVRVKLPVLEMVRLWEARTPEMKADVVPPPAARVPVELTSAVFPTKSKAVTVLLFASSAVIWMSKEPQSDAVCS